MKQIILSLFLSIIFAGCTFGNKSANVKKIIHQKHIDLSGKTYSEDISIYGKIDPELKVALKVDFEGSKTSDGCFGRSGGWSSFRITTASVSSKTGDTYKLSLPLKWEDAMGENVCDYYVHRVYMTVSYPEKKAYSTMILALPSDYDDYFAIDGKNYLQYARDYKARHLTGLSNYKCVYSKDTTPKLICKSNLDVSNIKANDTLPNSLSYGITISLKKSKESP